MVPSPPWSFQPLVDLVELLQPPFDVWPPYYPPNGNSTMAPPWDGSAAACLSTSYGPPSSVLEVPAPPQVMLSGQPVTPWT